VQLYGAVWEPSSQIISQQNNFSTDLLMIMINCEVAKIPDNNQSHWQ